MIILCKHLDIKAKLYMNLLSADLRRIRIMKQKYYKHFWPNFSVLLGMKTMP